MLQFSKNSKKITSDTNGVNTKVTFGIYNTAARYIHIESVIEWRN